MEGVLVYLQFVPVELPAACGLDDEGQAVQHRLTDRFRLQSPANTQLALVKHSQHTPSQETLPGGDRFRWLWQYQLQAPHVCVAVACHYETLRKHSSCSKKEFLADFLVSALTRACREANPIFMHFVYGPEC